MENINKENNPETKWQFKISLADGNKLGFLALRRFRGIVMSKKSPFESLKSPRTWSFAIGFLISSENSYADSIMNGLQKTNTYIKTGAITLSTIAIIGAGLIMAFNKERGFDKMSGAIIGLACIAGASALVALVQSFFA